MLTALSARGRFERSAAFVLLCVLLAVIQISGGASRADAFGQVVVRAAAWLLLILGILFGNWPDFRKVGPLALLLATVIILPLLQLIPLPPSIWTLLPGRDLFVQAADLVGEVQPWRPWTLVPVATMNAASSLIVPVAILWLTLSLGDDEQRYLPGVLLCLVLASTLVGLVQTSSFTFDNPLINETPGTVSGTFANRNHFALQLAMGCVLALLWAFDGRPAYSLAGAVGLMIVFLFILAILVSGSRAGLLLGGLGLGLGFLFSLSEIRRALARSARWAFPILMAVAGASIVGLVFLGVLVGRARSIDRLFAMDPGQDMRTRGLSALMSMVREYFPAGSGIGGFDPIFRLHEPFALLKPTYFNHAHNDFLEVMIDVGLPGLTLLAAGLCWWGWASIKAWRAGSSGQAVRAKTGSAMLLLLIVASLVDYPARTPVIMAWAMIAAIWLGQGAQSKALPVDA